MQTRRSRAKAPKALKPAAETLSTTQTLFALTYLTNGHNATAAYQAAHPRATRQTCSVEGCRHLAIPKIKKYIEGEIERRWKALHMDADEVMARVALDARSDPSMLYDDKGVLLEPYKWPVEVRNSIESFERTGDGGVKVRFVSKGQARRTILELTGKLKNPIAGGLSDLARAIREDLGEAADAG